MARRTREEIQAEIQGLGPDAYAQRQVLEMELSEVRIEEIQEQMRDLEADREVDGVDKEAKHNALELEMSQLRSRLLQAEMDAQLQRGMLEIEMDEFYDQMRAQDVDYADVEGQWRSMASERDRLDERIQYLEQRLGHGPAQEREAGERARDAEQAGVDREMGDLYQAAAPVIGQIAAADLVERQSQTVPPTLSQKVAERLARHPELVEAIAPKTRTEKIEAWGSHISRPEAEQSETSLDR